MELFEWTPSGPQPLEPLLERLAQQRVAGLRIVTTNGCFDLLHVGHIRFLGEARAQGDLLIVGLNSDESVRRLKGAGRPLLAQDERAEMLAALRSVDHVVVFGDQYPDALLEAVRPDIHCKAGDYTLDTLPETSLVRRHGGEVRILPLAPGYSTSRLVERIRASAQEHGGPGQSERGARRAAIVERLLSGANMLRQTAYGLGAQIESAVRRVVGALAAGERVLVSGDEASAALARDFADDLAQRYRRACEASGKTPTGQILCGASDSGQPGDIVLLIGVDAVAPARRAGSYVIALTGAGAAPGATADLWLRAPSEERGLARLAQVAVLQLIGEQIEQMIIEESIHGWSSGSLPGSRRYIDT